jgi:hypothetical protein
VYKPTSTLNSTSQPGTSLEASFGFKFHVSQSRTSLEASFDPKFHGVTIQSQELDQLQTTGCQIISLVWWPNSLHRITQLTLNYILNYKLRADYLSLLAQSWKLFVYTTIF